MTVYYQFKSKARLLEALFDDFAARANMRDLLHVLTSFETYDALAAHHEPKNISPLLARAAQAVVTSSR